MAVKLVVLKSGENIISEIKEGYFEQKLVCYILDKPCTISVNGTYKILDDNDDGENKVSISLNSWPSLSKQSTIELVPDWIVTVVDPIDSLKKMYETQVLGIKNEDGQTIVISEQSDSNQSD